MTQNAVSLRALDAVRIVLVSPAGPLNVGSAARVMKNFGLSQLVLVAPQCDVLGPEALQMAVHADDILRGAKRVETIPEALVGCEIAIATTARIRGFNAPLHPPEAILPTLITPSAAQTALIFGPEDRGLSNTELTYAQFFTKIPTTDTYSALNLAQAVAVCCYELYRTNQSNLTSDLPKSPSTTNTSPPSPLPPPLYNSLPSPNKKDSPLQNAPLSDKQTESNQQLQATLDELEGYYQHLESVLLKVEYLYPHTATARMRKVRQLLHRTAPTSNEVALLRGMLRQVEWALSDSNKG